MSIDLDASDVENDNLTYTIVQTPSETDGESGTLGVLDGNTITYTNHRVELIVLHTKLTMVL